ncbi:hypothetical protein BRC86_01850 [Halobacteriales archaeon QS_3_64_16]|nr:MAG: hypothetical protein BRC86_01850 [Halobacteriales archaeon QS_3_64_16]
MKAGAGVSVAAALSGCIGGDLSGGGSGGGSASSESGGTTLDIWLSYYTEGETKRTYTDEIISQYEEETGNSINVTGVPYTDVSTKFQAARASGDVPHLVEVMTRPGILAGGAGMRINDAFQSSKLADTVSEKVLRGHKVWGQQSTGEQGALVSVPIGFRPYFSCWRTDWLKEANIDPAEVNHKAGSLHWREDIPAIYDKLKQTELGQKEGHFPDTTGMKQSDEEYMSLYGPQHGGSLSGVVNEDGTEATIDSQSVRDAVQLQKEYIENGYFHENSINFGDEESTTAHWSGQIAVNHIQDSTDLWGDYLEEQPDAMKNGAYTWGLPMNAGTKAALAWLPGLGFIADAFSGGSDQEALETAMGFVEWWVANGQRAVQNAKKLGFVPVDPNLISQEDFFGQSPLHQEFWRGAAMKTLENFESSVIPAVAGADAITYDIPRSMHQSILGQGVPVEEATANAAEQINEVLQRNQGGGGNNSSG